MATPMFEQLTEFHEQVIRSGGVLSDVEPTKFQIKDLEFISVLEEGEEPIDGESMCRRAVKLKANFGLRDSKYLLEHQEEIPAKLRGKKYILLPRTILSVPSGGLRVPGLSWLGNRLIPRFYWLVNGFNSRAYFARIK